MSFQNHLICNSSHQQEIYSGESHSADSPPSDSLISPSLRAFVPCFPVISTPTSSTTITKTLSASGPATSSSFSIVRTAKIPVFYSRKTAEVVNDWHLFFGSPSFQSVLKNHSFSLRRGVNNRLCLDWPKNLFHDYVKSHDRNIHKRALLFEFYQSMTNQRQTTHASEILDDPENEKKIRIFTNTLLKSDFNHSTTSTDEVINDRITIEVFFIFKVFEFIWLTYNFRCPAAVFTQSFHFGPLLEEEIHMDPKQSKGMIVDWNEELQKLQTSECIAQFEGPFLIDIRRSESDPYYFNHLSEIPENHLLFPTFSFFKFAKDPQIFKCDSLMNSQCSGFDFKNLRVLSTFLSGKKDFVKALNTYLSKHSFSNSYATVAQSSHSQASNSPIQSTKKKSPTNFQSISNTFNRTQTANIAANQTWESPRFVDLSPPTQNNRPDKNGPKIIDPLTLIHSALTSSISTSTPPIFIRPTVLSHGAMIEEEFSVEQYLEYVDLLTKKIFGTKKWAEILLEAIKKGLATRNGECSFKVEDPQNLRRLLAALSFGHQQMGRIAQDCFEFLEIRKDNIDESSSSKEEQNIPSNLAEWIVPALLIHKLKELSVHAKYPKAKNETKSDLPVFFVVPERKKVRIYCFQGSFEGFVIKKIQNTSALSYHFLENLLTHDYMEKEEKDGCMTALISVEVFDELEKLAKNSLILKPTVLKFQKDSIKQNNSTESSLISTKSVDIELSNQKVGEKRKKRLSTDVEPPQKIHRSNERTETGTEHTIKEAYAIQNGIQIIQSAQKAPSPTPGMSQTLQPLVAKENASIALSPENFLEQVSSATLKETIVPIQERNMIKSVLHNNREIEFPIHQHIEGLDPSRPLSPFNPLLKDYQKKAVAEMLRFSDKGLSSFLAAEMGLGKTFMMFEWASQLIASGKEGMHLFIMPVSLLPQMQEEIQRAWFEMNRTAWQTRKRSEPTNILKNAVLEALQDCPQGSYQRINLLYAITPFLHEWIEDRSFEAYLEVYRIIPDIIQVVNLHLNNIKKIPAWKKTFEDTLKREEIRKTNSYGKIYNYQVFNMCWNVRENHVLSKHFLLNAATILNIHPGREVRFSSDQTLEEAKRMTNLHNNPPVTFFDASTFAEYLERPAFIDAGFIMTSFECLQNKKKDIESLLGSKKIGSIIVDEADRLHNMDSKDTECVKRLLENSKEKGTLLQLISGTPFQNSFAEIYTLISLANPPGAFPSETQKALAYSLDRCIGRITQEKEISQKKLHRTVMKTFVDFNALADVIRKVIIRVAMQDENVIKDWNYQIPSFEVKKIAVDLKADVKDKIQSIKNQKANFLKEFHQIKQVLIHPALENLDRTSCQTNRIIQILQSASPEELSQHIENSPLLKGLMGSEAIQECIHKKDRTIIFVQNLVEADIIKAVIGNFYKIEQPIIDIYEGSLKTQERNAIVHRFKTGQDGRRPHFLILMTECGGVGLNLQEAARCIIASQSFNPSKDDQARARCIRANNVGHKIIYEIHHNDVSSSHLRSIRQEKRDWVKFLFTPSSSTMEDRFQCWRKLLTTICKKKFINNDVSEEHPRYQLFLKRMAEVRFDEQYISSKKQTAPTNPLLRDLERESDIIPMEDSFETAATSSREPAPKERIVETPASISNSTTRLNTKDWWVLPIPVQWSSGKILKMSAYIRQHQIKGLPEMLVDINNHKLVDVIRTGVSDDSRAQNILNFYEALASQAESSGLDLETVNVQTYRIENHQFVLSTETIKNGTMTVRLYEKERVIAGNSQLHLDILLRK